ncbi:1-acyl-sn-glycerol-3-phosphate acyltransferase [Aquimarina sp. ERC-38]|uniref:lysophospholipid acyltransferase family protein n=1 Tax=Aquimarina sp. ERC-38 TaxID=2949996 RepID=UPI002245F326|nr:lysophospholipid acyltransferase family protein [Aquimarina sp. ERC-38]UZO82029.1 1-acyl-sn-glycerol-3-phosphate acyltransferase [Aquimarina sp. ERC-38]
MIVFKNILIILWRIWFYLVMMLPILILLPVLLILLSRAQWYPYFFKIARGWAAVVLYCCGFFPKINTEEKIDKKQSYMFVANHTSMLDILMMFYGINNPFVFVAKYELSKVLVFGWVYKSACILVDRKNRQSKKEVFTQAQNRLNNGTSICIFPEGGVPDDLNLILDTFKDGAFRLAIDHQIPIVPITFLDNKKHFSFNFLSGSPGILNMHIHAKIETKGLGQDARGELRNHTRTIILQKLQESN